MYSILWNAHEAVKGRDAALLETYWIENLGNFLPIGAPPALPEAIPGHLGVVALYAGGHARDGTLPTGLAVERCVLATKQIPRSLQPVHYPITTPNGELEPRISSQSGRIFETSPAADTCCRQYLSAHPTFTPTHMVLGDTPIYSRAIPLSQALHVIHDSIRGFSASSIVSILAKAEAQRPGPTFDNPKLPKWCHSVFRTRASSSQLGRLRSGVPDTRPF